MRPPWYAMLSQHLHRFGRTTFLSLPSSLFSVLPPSVTFPSDLLFDAYAGQKRPIKYHLTPVPCQTCTCCDYTHGRCFFRGEESSAWCCMHNAQKAIFNLGWFFSAYVNNHSVVEIHHSFTHFPCWRAFPRCLLCVVTILLCSASPKRTHPHLRNPDLLIYGKSLYTMSLYHRLHQGSPFRRERARE